MKHLTKPWITCLLLSGWQTVEEKWNNWGKFHTHLFWKGHREQRENTKRGGTVSVGVLGSWDFWEPVLKAAEAGRPRAVTAIPQRWGPPVWLSRVLSISLQCLNPTLCATSVPWTLMSMPATVLPAAALAIRLLRSPRTWAIALPSPVVSGVGSWEQPSGTTRLSRARGRAARGQAARTPGPADGTRGVRKFSVTLCCLPAFSTWVRVGRPSKSQLPFLTSHFLQTLRLWNVTFQGLYPSIVQHSRCYGCAGPCRRPAPETPRAPAPAEVWPSLASQSHPLRESAGIAWRSEYKGGMWRAFWGKCELWRLTASFSSIRVIHMNLACTAVKLKSPSTPVPGWLP